MIPRARSSRGTEARRGNRTAWILFGGALEKTARLAAAALSPHRGLTACGQSHAAFERRCIPAEPRRCAPLIVAFRSKYTRASSPGGGSSLTRLVSRAPNIVPPASRTPRGIVWPHPGRDRKFQFRRYGRRVWGDRSSRPFASWCPYSGAEQTGKQPTSDSRSIRATAESGRSAPGPRPDHSSGFSAPFGVSWSQS